MAGYSYLEKNQTFAQWQEWFYSVSEQSGLFELRDATYVAVENMRTVGIEFTSFPAGYDVYVEAALDSYYIFEPNGSFFATDDFSQPNPNTYVFNADSSIEFLQCNSQERIFSNKKIDIPRDSGASTANAKEINNYEYVYIFNWDRIAAVTFVKMETEIHLPYVVK